MPPRRRKTPETDIARRIRVYALGYEKDGQKERAEGMRQAADLVDDLMRGMTIPTMRDIFEPSLYDKLEARVSHIEGQLRSLSVGPGDVAVRLRKFQEALATDTKAGDFAAASVGRKTQRALQKVAQRKTPIIVANLSDNPGATVALASGERRVLIAVAGYPDARNDDIAAMTGYRSTSVHTYLKNLRAGGFIESHAGRHSATKPAEELVRGEHVMVGSPLLEWWLEEGRLARGERFVLKAITSAPGPVRLSDLAAPNVTDLKLTSVHTYVKSLVRRRLVVRNHGRVELAPILSGVRS